jgi:Na+/proline symporter
MEIVKFNLDVVIVVAFLIINLVAGLYYAGGKTTLREYAVGDKKFSTSTLVATIIATCIGGGFFSGAITESYKQGLYFIIPAAGEPLALMIIGYFLIPRMSEFLGDLSVADALGNLYGRYVRIIAAIAGIFLCIGIVALQFKVGASILGVFFKIPSFYSVLLCALVVTIYSAFGGVKAVTFTDIIQFFTFGTVVPIISLVIWGTMDNPYSVFTTLTQNPLFNYEQVFDFSNTRFTGTVFLLMFFLVPDFQPVFFQRVLMAKNTSQGQKAFLIAGLVCLALLFVISWVGILLLSNNPTLDPNDLLPYIISTYSYTGLKGLTAVGVMAVIMSSADSYINAASVLFTNDILKSLEIKRVKLFNELLIASTFAFFVGSMGFLLAFKSDTILHLLLFVLSFYVPVVSAPLLLSIFGFRSTSVSVLTGIFAGCVCVVISILCDVQESIIPIASMLVNISFLIATHYLFKQPGGWVGIKDPEPLIMIRLERKRKIQNFIKSVKEFNFINFCRNNAPKEEYIYSLFGLFCIISVFSGMYSIPVNIQKTNAHLVELIYHTVLFYSSVFLTYPVWPPLFKRENFIIIAWNIGVPYILLFSPTLLIIINDVGQFQSMVLLVNIIVIAMLLRWQVVVPMMVLSMFSAVEFYKWFVGVENVILEFGSLKFKIMYLLLMVSSVCIAFLRPKQQDQEISELIRSYLSDDNKQKQLELLRLSQYRQEFINRVDQQCVGALKSIHNQISVLSSELSSKDNNNYEANKQAVLQILDRIKAATSYLDKVISQVKDSVKIHPVKIDLEEFMCHTIDEYKRINRYSDLEISQNFHTTLKEIEIDPSLIQKAIITCLNHAIMHSVSDHILINFEPCQIEYNVEDDNPLKIRRDGIKILITVPSAAIELDELSKLINPTFNSVLEVNFAEMHKIIVAHYGEFSVILDSSNSIVYSITLPMRLKEIRPKKMDLPDAQLTGIVAIDRLIRANDNQRIHDIAVELIKSGMDLPSISRITKLTLSELKELDL